MVSFPDTLIIKLNARTVGTLTRLVNETIVFAFDPKYEADENRPILSLGFKGSNDTLVPDRPRTGSRLSPFFSNLLPEGHLREYLARKLGIGSHREFFLLAALGLDLPGAVIAEPLGAMSEEFTEKQGAKNQQSRPLRFSLAGVQLKFSAIAEAKGTFTIPASGAGGSWIVKLPSEQHEKIPEVEFSMLTLAKLAGINVPECELVSTSAIDGLPKEFGNLRGKSLAIKRFDRTDSGGRIHMEDFAQVYGVYPQDKYQKAGYAHIAQVLLSETGEDCYCEFVRRLVFTIAIGNGDMHLKNWSLLYSNPQKPELSPAYDFVPTISYIENDSLALNLGGTKDFHAVTLDKFAKLANAAKASEKLTTTIAEETIEKVKSVWTRNRYDLLLPDTVRQDIDSHMSKLRLFKSRN